MVIIPGSWANLYLLWLKSASPANVRSPQCRIPMISGRLCFAGVWGSYDHGNLGEIQVRPLVIYNHVCFFITDILLGPRKATFDSENVRSIAQAIKKDFGGELLLAVVQYLSKCYFTALPSFPPMISPRHTCQWREGMQARASHSGGQPSATTTS